MSKEFKTIAGTCEICGKVGQVWVSSDCHETGAVCSACAKSEGMEQCRYCGDMRYPENLESLDPARYTQYGKYCVGCIDDAAEAARE